MFLAFKKKLSWTIYKIWLKCIFFAWRVHFYTIFRFQSEFNVQRLITTTYFGFCNFHLLLNISCKRHMQLTTYDLLNPCHFIFLIVRDNDMASNCKKQLYQLVFFLLCDNIKNKCHKFPWCDMLCVKWCEHWMST
jgi:hypothetical protein